MCSPGLFAKELICMRHYKLAFFKFNISNLHCEHIKQIKKFKILDKRKYIIVNCCFGQGYYGVRPTILTGLERKKSFSQHPNC